ncbi:MAG: hypothetical protein EA398_01060 [Deltaproteobacteria bacterium]|nr:MAG: hypothetical protein EA398_01060 [Deltaproteobacteria bacterium]
MTGSVPLPILASTMATRSPHSAFPTAPPGLALLLLATSLTWLPTSPAHAGSDFGENAPGLVLRDDARAIRANPANLAFHEGLHIAFDHETGLTGDQVDRQALRTALALSPASGFGAGVAGRWLLQPEYEAQTEVALALGGPFAAIGLSRTWSFHRAGEERPDYASTALALSSRPSPHVATALRVRHLNRPRTAEGSLQRQWAFAVGLQSRWGEAGGELAIVAPENALDRGAVQGSLRIRATDAIRLFGGGTLGNPDERDGFLSGGWTAHGGIEFVVGGATLSSGLHGSGDSGADGLVLVSGAELHAPGRGQPLDRARTTIHLVLRDRIPEQPRSGFLVERAPGFATTIAQLDRLAREGEVGALVLDLERARLGPAQAWELARVLERLETAGIPVTVRLREPRLAELFVAAHGRTVVMAPADVLASSGVAWTGFYVGALLDRLGVRPQFERIAEWKTAPDTFERTGPSDEERAQVQAWIDTVWEVWVEGIAARRNRPADAVRALLDGAPVDAEALREAGLVDDVRHGPVSTASFVPLDEWWDRRSDAWAAPRRIAVLHIDGLIAPGDSSPEGLLQGVVTGDRGVARAVRAIRRDTGIRGVIVRVSSGGGSVLASDEIRHLLAELAAEKPVVVSFGDIAASGGYYVAAIEGVRIVASPTTLTGSIGIFAGAVDIDPLLQRLGVHRERFEAGGRTDLFGTRAWSEEERGSIRAMIASSYDRFLALVGTARGLSREALDGVAGGRIHSGRAAREAGLLDDSESGLLGALDEVLARGGLRPGEPFDLVHFPDGRRRGIPGTLAGVTAQDRSVEVERLARWLGRAGGTWALEVAWLMESGGPTMLALLPWHLP